jgi:hypothetical protein
MVAIAFIMGFVIGACAGALVLAVISINACEKDSEDY